MASTGKRVLTLARNVSFSIPLQSQQPHYPLIFRGFFSTDPSISITNPLLLKLLQEPTLSVKSVLDSQENGFLCSSRLSLNDLVTSLISSSKPKTAQLVTLPILSFLLHCCLFCWLLNDYRVRKAMVSVCW